MTFFDRLEPRQMTGLFCVASLLRGNDFCAIIISITLPKATGGQAMKTYTIIGGINGTGKSSLTGVLKTQTTDLGIVIDVDKISAQNGGSALTGGRIALERIADCLKKNVSFTQETTLSGRKTEITAAQAKRQGYFVRLYYVGLDTLVASLARIETRGALLVLFFTHVDVQRRFAGRWAAVAKVLPYCDEALFFDNDNGFVEVAEYANGELILKGSTRPEWVLKLADYLKRPHESIGGHNEF